MIPTLKELEDKEAGNNLIPQATRDSLYKKYPPTRSELPTPNTSDQITLDLILISILECYNSKNLNYHASID